MQNILVFGAGKSASVLINYLLENSTAFGWKITVADANESLILEKTKNHPNSIVKSLDILNNDLRKSLIETADIVISMMPPSLHILIAKDCLDAGKNLLTASYASDEIKALDAQVKAKGLIFLCEMGLDPGIDHLSAMQIIDEIKGNGGTIDSFKSHCGGLVAPESDDNPWHYKISWNPRNVVLAGKAGALYLQNNKKVEEHYHDLFNHTDLVDTYDEQIGQLGYYPNRNSLDYIDLYGMQSATEFVRTTLRYPTFLTGWKNIVLLNLADENAIYETENLSIAKFYQQHFKNHNLAGIVEDYLQDELFKKQMDFLGLTDDETLINKGLCSAADVMVFVLEQKLILKNTDKDMIVMVHEFGYQKSNQNHKRVSSLVVKGDDNIRTAMAKTVGLPLAIATKLILEKKIDLKGVQIPVSKEIYQPVLKELSSLGISFIEKEFSV